MPKLSEMDQSVLSDMHKDARGFRPRGAEFWAAVYRMTGAEFEAMRAGLQAEIEESIKLELDAEARAVAVFEKRIAQLAAVLEIARETAIRWDKQAMDSDDESYYCWLNGLPEGYLSRAA